MKQRKIFKYPVLIFLLLSIALNGCRTAKEITPPPEEVKPREMEIVEVEKGIETPPVEELTPEERRRIEAEELARRERAAAVSKAFEFKDIHFDFDKAELSTAARETLSNTAEWLEENVDIRLRIEGHADERGTSEYNIALGDRRAEAVRRYLVTLGIDPKRFTTISFGEEMPLDTGHDEEAWRKNRRVHFEVVER